MQRRVAVIIGCLTALWVAQGVAAGSAHAAVAFSKSQVSGAGTTRPTSLQFGPDGRLYIAEQYGVIKAFTVKRSGTGSYAAGAPETITLVNKMPNRNDDGSPAPAVGGRLVTGLLVTGTAAAPVIYVASSDPRIGAGPDKGDLDLDTNSGVLSKLTRAASGWVKHDLVRGLPRSEENHTANGLALSPNGSTLYIAQGGNTNNGAPSKNFALLPEYALSAAVLSVDLAALPSGKPYDLPTLDDGMRPGAADANDPFGGNDGLNQARLVPGGPVQVHAPGMRNPYDVLVTKSGRMFTVDNGANGGWGGTPAGEGPSGGCTNAPSDPGTTNYDELFDITKPGTYGGHPNPVRGNKANVFGGQSPVAVANPIECDFRDQSNSGALAHWTKSTNGLAEYTASNFDGAMKGNLLTVGLGNTVERVQLKPGGATKSTLVNQAGGSSPLDVVAQGDGGPFPGTVWYVDVGNGATYVLEPADYDGKAASCDLANPRGDADRDGFTNADEQAANTNPCSSADRPADADGDRSPDVVDADDDNDGLSDVSDPFARDAHNGLGTTVGVRYLWENDGAAPGGLLNLGFTGLMTNGRTDYQALYDEDGMTAGGAAGVVTVDAVEAGDALGATNSQKHGFQFGVRARPESGPFTVRTRIVAPFDGLTPKDSQSFGVFIGTGDQDNYVKLVAGKGGGTRVQALREVGGATTSSETAVALPGPDFIDLHLVVDPRTAMVQASFTQTTRGVTSARMPVGPAMTVPAGWFTAPTGLAVGILATSGSSGTPFPATWDFIEVTPSGGVAGNAVTSPADQPPAITSRDTVAPRLTRLSVRRRFRVATRARFTLSEAGTARAVFYRARAGRRVRGRCVKPRGRRSGARCVRYVRVPGVVTRGVRAGRVSLRLASPAPTRALAPGDYRVHITVVDAAGNRSATRRVTVRRIR